MQENDMIKVHIYSGNEEIKTRNYDKVFRVYKKQGRLGIDWNDGHTSKDEMFAPFNTFTSSVIFENVENGETFCFDNISNSVVKVA